MMRQTLSRPSSEPRLGLAFVLSTLLCAFAGNLGCQHFGGAPATGYSRSSEAAGADAAPASTSSAPSAYEKSGEAEGRPGLGTVWGENRHSPVREVSFERSSESPAFLGSLLYNDAEGVATLRSRLGRRYSGGEPVFRALGAAGASRGVWGGVIVRVTDGQGRMLPAYHMDDRVLLIGEAGQRYAIEIENRTDQRFEVVASVDGLDVIDGRAASLDKQGYVIASHGHLRIDGFRRSMSEVASFRFGSVRDSYAAKSAEFGDRHVGVIGVALFAERGSEPAALPIERPIRRPDLDDDAARRETADPFPGRFAQPPPGLRDTY